MKETKTMKNFIFAILAGSTFTACGAFQEASKDIREETEKRADLTGKWASDCHPSGLMEGKFATLEYDFSPAQTFTYTTKIYGDSGCSAHEATLTSDGSYSLPGDVKAGSQELDIDLNDTTLTPQSKAQADQYNANTQCGYTDWQAGYTKSVKGTDCAALPFTQEDKYYNLFDVREDTLYLGEPQLFQAPLESAQRQRSVNLDVPFKK